MSSEEESKPEVFGKYDIRGRVPEELDTEIVFGVGRSLGDFYGEGKVLVGHDHRRSSKIFSEAVKTGIASQGVDVVDVGLVATDMVAWKVKNGDYAGGVVLTASHMPPEFGGIKPLNHEGRILSNQEQDKVKSRYGKREDAETYGKISSADFTDEFISAAVERVRELVGEVDVRVVVDPGNGVGVRYLPDILELLGAEVELINENMNPEFPNRSPEPKEQNLKVLSSTVLETDADLGIALDGDADRAVFIDDKGEVISGHDSLALLSKFYAELGVEEVVVSVDTGLLVKNTLGDEAELKEVPPGAIFTALECQKKAGFGGQPNGHLMDAEFVPYDSGNLLGAVMAGLSAETPLSERLQNLPEYLTESFDFRTDDKSELLEETAKILEKTAWCVERKHGALVAEQGGKRLMVRPSGTEPVLRVRSETAAGREKPSVKKILEKAASQL